VNEFLFYVGIVLAIAFLILAIVLFFTQKIPEVIRFLLKIPNHRTIKISNNENITAFNMKATNDTGTELLQDQTELLNMAENFATALLDVESVHNLEYLNEHTSGLG
jgi:hypothetical protein